MYPDFWFSKCRSDTAEADQLRVRMWARDSRSKDSAKSEEQSGCTSASAARIWSAEGTVEGQESNAVHGRVHVHMHMCTRKQYCSLQGFAPPTPPPQTELLKEDWKSERITSGHVPHCRPIKYTK